MKFFITVHSLNGVHETVPEGKTKTTTTLGFLPSPKCINYLPLTQAKVTEFIVNVTLPRYISYSLNSDHNWPQLLVWPFQCCWKHLKKTKKDGVGGWEVIDRVNTVSSLNRGAHHAKPKYFHSKHKNSLMTTLSKQRMPFFRYLLLVFSRKQNKQTNNAPPTLPKNATIARKTET